MRNVGSLLVCRKLVLSLCCAALLSACGLDGNGGSSQTADTETGTGTSPSTGTAPSPVTSTGTTGGAGTAKATSVALSGSPSSTAPVNQAYLFTPQLQATSSGFTFSIRNKPSWATFDISSGAIRGTPTIAQVGTYTDIVISATNGSVTAALPAFSIVVPSDAPSTNAVTLSWQPPAHNVDGTVMTNLAGYRIYHGPAEDQLSNSITVSSPGITSHTVSNLGAGTHFFGISAYNANGAESEILVIGSKRLM